MSHNAKKMKRMLCKIWHIYSTERELGVLLYLNIPL